LGAEAVAAALTELELDGHATAADGLYRAVATGTKGVGAV
jgi:hypothetical protein